MFARHVTAQLARYADGDLLPGDVHAVDTHLAACESCRGALEEIRFAGRLVRQLAVVSAPASVWHGIDGALTERHVSPSSRVPRWAFAAILLLVVGAGSLDWWGRAPSSGPWRIEALTNGGTSRQMAAGELIDTGQGSRMRIRVGEIGTVDVEPGTRVRLGEIRPTEYRLAVERGTISARIAAPPRLFIVDTPTSTVVDLGCAYTVTVSEDGASVLRMTEGWSALEWRGRESLVPAGAICRTRPDLGPGMPYFEDAPGALKQAVDAFDSGAGGADAVTTVLREARVRDTLTLWHLLSRVNASDRARVFDRIAQLVPPPAGVARERALALDPDTLRVLREELAWHW